MGQMISSHLMEESGARFELKTPGFLPGVLCLSVLIQKYILQGRQASMAIWTFIIHAVNHKSTVHTGSGLDFT